MILNWNQELVRCCWEKFPCAMMMSMTTGSMSQSEDSRRSKKMSRLIACSATNIQNGKMIRSRISWLRIQFRAARVLFYGKSRGLEMKRSARMRSDSVKNVSAYADQKSRAKSSRMFDLNSVERTPTSFRPSAVSDPHKTVDKRYSHTFLLPESRSPLHCKGQ